MAVPSYTEYRGTREGITMPGIAVPSYTEYRGTREGHHEAGDGCAELQRAPRDTGGHHDARDSCAELYGVPRDTGGASRGPGWLCRVIRSTAGHGRGITRPGMAVPSYTEYRGTREGQHEAGDSCAELYGVPRDTGGAS